MDKAKKTAPAAPGKKKVIRRLVKNAKTGEIIKTEIVRIDSSGEMTVTSYPAGTPVPSLSSLQSQSSSQTKKSTRKTSTETKPASPKRKPSQEMTVTPKPETPIIKPFTSPPKPKMLPKAYEESTAKNDSSDIGPSVPANVPGLEDLIKKEEEMRRLPESEIEKHEKTKPKEGEESLETALISIMKRKRQRDPKARRRGLVASTMARRASDDELDKALDEAYEDTDYRSISSSKKEEAQEDEEAERKRRERHRRRKEKKQKERSQPADRDDVEEYQGETGPLDLPEIESYRKRDEETPMDGVEVAGPQLPDGEEVELSKKLEDASIKPDAEADTQPVEKEDEESGSDDDKKKKKKKHKHKKKKKKTKKQKKRDSKSESEKEEDKEEREKIPSKSRSRSRSRSLSSISLSSISSAFSDSFDFAGMNFDPAEEGGFDMALMEYQQMRDQVLGGPFAGGRGFDPFFRGRGSFRGFPRGRGFPGPFPAWRGPGPMFHFFQADPNFQPFPGGPMGPDGEKGGDATRGRGAVRGVPANQGPWRGRGLRGRGIPPGFHRNYTEDDQGGAVYVEESGSSSSESGKKKKKKKHRRRSYSSSSYSSSGSSRSRSRSRRRHRRRHRSSSYSSRSSRSYSRSSYSSRSRSYRSYSRSSRSRSSYSRSSYSRSRSRSARRSKSPGRASPKSWGYGSGDGMRRASPSYHAYDEDGFKPPVREPHSDDEEVPWWAEFDKTYEVEKKKLEEDKKKLEEEERAMKGEVKEPQPPSIVSTDEIDVVRCVMTLVDKARSQQDEAIETARECIDDMITKISTAPIQATQLHEEMEDPFEKVIHDCVDSILDRVCPNDPQTAARLCLKEIIDTVVEQEEEDKANEEATEMEKEITESSQSRLFQCYLKAQKLTEQMKAQRNAKGLPEDSADADKNQDDDDRQKSDDKHRDKKGHRSRHRRRSRSRSRDRGRRRRRRSSSGSRSSSRSSDARVPLVSEESLRQAQALLTMQQQQLQVAGLLGTGMPNLAGLTQAAALAAGITPALLAQTGLKSSDLPGLMGEKVPEKEEATTKVPSKWDKDKVEAMSKKDDLTRKLMQRMREKKMKQEDGEASPTFQARKDKGADATTEKVFTGGNLKSRKIAISSTFGKLWSKVEGSPRRDEDSQDGSKFEIKGYNKSDIVAAATEAKDQPNAEKLKAEEQEKKLAAWSDQQARLKEEAKREMREQIERAERAKKEQMKEEILEQERQKEIMRIREEVRNQIRKEIQEEIEKQRKTVLEDPAVRDRLLELEALRSQSGLMVSEGVSAAGSSSSMPVAVSTPQPTMPTVPQSPQMRDQRWYQQQMKNKQDMTKWMESHGYYESEMDDAAMKRMQMTYMQNWTPAQRQGYMQWYWQQKQYPGPGYYPPHQQHMMGQRQPQGASHMGRHQGDLSVTPTQPQRSEHQGMVPLGRGAMTHQGQRIPYRGRGMQHMPGRQGPRGHGIPSLMDQPLWRGRGYDQTPSQPPSQYNEAERQTFDYNHERYPVRGDLFWQQDSQQQQTPTQQPQAQQAPPQQQQTPKPPVQQPQPQSVQNVPTQPQAPAQQQPQQGQEIPSILEMQPNQVPEESEEASVTEPKDKEGEVASPWFTDEIQQAIRLRNTLYRRYKNKKNEHIFAQFKIQRRQVRIMVQLAKERYELSKQGASNQTGEQTDNLPPLHQYPPPGLEDEDDQNLAAPKPIPPQGIQQVPDQPPPPGESADTTKPPMLGVPGASELAPPGEEASVPVVPPPALQPVQMVDESDSPAKAKKKKKQKKHRKHKKKKYSSSDDEDENDPEAEKLAILAKLQDLQDVEDGEIASDDGLQMTMGIDDKEMRRKKKHKKEKKKHKRRRDDSSDEDEQVTPAPQPVQPLQPPTFFPPPGMQPRPPFDPARQNFPTSMPGEQLHHYPPHSAAGGYGAHPPSMYPPPDPGSLLGLGNRDRPGFPPHSRDHRGSGEPQRIGGYPEPRKPPMGPSGDHNVPLRKRTPSPLPLVVPTDPQEFEIWQRKMHAKYNDTGPPKEGEATEASANIDTQLLKDIETIRRRQGDRDHHGSSNDDVIMMLRMMDDEQRRQRPSPLPHDRPLRDGRKRGHGMMSRGRKRQRRPPPRKNYHDWDKPEDDGLIYTHSGSDSSGWGSDSNMDFDRMLAKKRRETEKEKRDNHPPPSQEWDRRNIVPRKDDLFKGGEKPQGIPVIGGGPRPIPTNVSANRPTPPRRHPDMMQADYLPPDVVKLPPPFPPVSYHQDPHMMEKREPRFPPPPMPPTAHPIPRLGGQGAPPIPPMMINPPLQHRMHHLDYRARYGM